MRRPRTPVVVAWKYKRIKMLRARIKDREEKIQMVMPKNERSLHRPFKALQAYLFYSKWLWRFWKSHRRDAKRKVICMMHVQNFSRRTSLNIVYKLRAYPVFREKRFWCIKPFSAHIGWCLFFICALNFSGHLIRSTKEYPPLINLRRLNEHSWRIVTCRHGKLRRREGPRSSPTG